MKHILLAALGAALLTACSDTSAITRAKEPDLLRFNQTAPPGAAPGTCWGKTVQTALVETVTEDILVQPAQVSSTGTVQAPPVYRSETRQRIVKERQETWFQAPCEPQLTVEFVSSVQRALAARNLYSGQITGDMDSRTRAAIRRFQQPEGLDSGILSVAAARRLGLWSITDDDPLGG